MANERVSQLTELLATELQTSDLFLITDMSLKESKKIEFNQIILFLQNSASFNAIYAKYCASASYVPAAGVDGTVRSASYAVWSNSGSHALYADRVTSASYADKSRLSDSASWAPPPTVGDTSSYALRAGYSDYAGTAYFLYYNGIPNGTSSWAISSSYALNTGRISQSDTASYLLYQSFPNGTSSYAISASYAPSSAITTQYVKAFAQITWSAGASTAKITVQNNIASFTYLNKFTATSYPAAYIAPSTWSQFSVVFTTPLSNTNYMVMGDGYQPYVYAERAGVIVHPIYSYKTIYGFTMSVHTSNASGGDWYTLTAGAYPNNQYPYVAFQVLGI